MLYSIIRGAGNRINSFSLRGKALLITGSVLMSLVIIGGLGVDFLIRRSFARLESEWIKENARRIQQLVTLEIDGLKRVTYDYSVWSDTYNFISTPSPAYIKSNFNNDVFKNLQIYGAFIYLPDGSRVTGYTLNSAGNNIEKADPGWDSLLGDFSKKIFAGGKKTLAGLVKYNGNVYFVSCHQVFQDSGHGNPAGTFIHLRIFNQQLLDRISSVAGLEITSGENPQITGKETINYNRNEGFFYIEKGREVIQLYIPLYDINKNQVTAGVTFLDRKINREGGRARSLFYILLAFIVFVAGLLNQSMLKKLVIFRLEKMFSGVKEVGDTLNLSMRLELHDKDELDELAGGINRMLDSLEEEKKRRDQAEQEKELLQEYMLQAKKMEAMGTMAGGIAHDFNNMLLIILGSAELLRIDLPADHPAMGHVNNIDKAGQNASALVRRMMTISKGYSATKIYLSVGHTISEMLNMIKANLPGYITVNLDNSITDDLIYADIAQFQQVVINLITNSAHAMAGKSKGSLYIKIGEAMLPIPDYRKETLSLAEGRYLRIEFSDTGNGIPVDIMDRIFEPFFSTKPVGSGTGLGLAVVHGFIVNNGGSIGVESVPGDGTTFIIHLPAVKEKRKPVIRANGEHIHILVVDDDTLVRKTIISGLQRRGYLVHEAASGHTALKLLEESAEPIRLVITDQMMPGMSGHELSIKIKSLHPDLPIILISGYISGMDDSSIEARNFIKILMKPVSMDELDKIISETMQNKEEV